MEGDRLGSRASIVNHGSPNRHQRRGRDSAYFGRPRSAALVEQMGSYLETKIEQVWPDRPDLVLLPEMCDRPTAYGFVFSEVVVPAKAGTQPASASYLVNGWIPAYAGMTHSDRHRVIVVDFPYAVALGRVTVMPSSLLN